MSNPSDEHMVAAKRVLRYLMGTPDLCVRYSKDFTRHWCSDASHRDDPIHSRRVSGACTCLQEEPVVEFSSCESECIALAYSSWKAVHLSDSLSEFAFPQFLSAQIYEDNNMGGLAASNKVIVSHVKTTDQLTNTFTKCLDYPNHPGQDNQIRFLSYAT